MNVHDWLSCVGQIEAIRFVSADRIIVATASKLAASLVTADGKNPLYR